ncbi:MAG: DUF599 domain-containing protein [Variovorax sp.]|nr:MAG: DUF599 domain-containing protein [Variovorax sp.]
MNVDPVWLSTLATFVLLFGYEAAAAVAQRRRPQRMARTAHAALREDWFTAVSLHKGSEVLSVQTLRNALMSATMTASTAVLGLMGTVTLAAPSLHLSLGEAAALPRVTPRLVLELLLLAFLFASLVCSAMAVRYYNHAGFISGMPVESEARQRWALAGAAYVRRAGLLYSWGLRHLILVAPILASLLHPFAGPVAAVLIVAVLSRFDRAAVREE